MVFHLEAFGYELLQPTGAAVDVEVSIASGAVEVVVVGRCNAGQFVPIGTAGNGDAGNLSGFLESSYCSVDRPQSQGIDGLGCQVVQFIDRQRSSSLYEGLADCLHLLGLALGRHGFSISLISVSTTLWRL